MNVKSCFLGNKKKITNFSSAELAQIVVIQKLRVQYPGAPSVVSLSKTLYLHNLCWFLPRKTLPRMSARVYDNLDKYISI